MADQVSGLRADLDQFNTNTESLNGQQKLDLLRRINKRMLAVMKLYSRKYDIITRANVVSRDHQRIMDECLISFREAAFSQTPPDDQGSIEQLTTISHNKRPRDQVQWSSTPTKNGARESGSPLTYSRDIDVPMYNNRSSYNGSTTSVNTALTNNTTTSYHRHARNRDKDREHGSGHTTSQLHSNNNSNVDHHHGHTSTTTTTATTAYNNTNVYNHTDTEYHDPSSTRPINDDDTHHNNEDDNDEDMAEMEMLDGDPDADADGDEVYCHCRRGASFGDMVGCDGEGCKYEWFHLRCVGLKVPPEEGEKWYCRDCAELLEIHKDAQADQKIKRSSRRGGGHNQSIV